MSDFKQVWVKTAVHRALKASAAKEGLSMGVFIGELLKQRGVMNE